MAEDGGNVGREEEISLAQADHERTLALGPHDAARVPFPEDTDRVGSRDVVQCAAHGHLDVRFLFEVLLDEVSDNLGVGLRAKTVSFLDEFLLERKVVLDDPVMDHDQIPAAIHVGVGVLLGGAAMRRPAGVPKPDGPDEVCAPDGVFQLLDLSDRSVHHHAPLLEHGQSGGVVAPVFEALQPVQQNRNNLLVSDVPDDATHSSPSFAPRSPVRGPTSDIAQPLLVNPQRSSTGTAGCRVAAVGDRCRCRPFRHRLALAARMTAARPSLFTC